MVTKNELSDKVDSVLSLGIDFSKLSRSDLEKLWDFVHDPSNLFRVGLKNIRDDARKKYIEEPVTAILKELETRPIINLNKKKVRNNGILGFGVFTGKRLNILKNRE